MRPNDNLQRKNARSLTSGFIILFILLGLFLYGIDKFPFVINQSLLVFIEIMGLYICIQLAWQSYENNRKKVNAVTSLFIAGSIAIIIAMATIISATTSIHS